MDVMQLRRRLLFNGTKWIEIINSQGLNRSYNSYSAMPNRCRTNDIYISAGQTMIIEIEGFDVAVGTWNANTKANVLYGGWNRNKNYTPAVDVLCKLVFRKTDNDSYVFTDDELRGLLKITVGNTMYLH